MAAIATRWCLRVLAATEVQGGILLCVVFQWGENTAFMLTITERLRGAATTTAPEVVLTGGNRNGIGATLSNYYRIHATS
jgi:hypothetical protein